MSGQFEKWYLDSLRMLTGGVAKGDRTGTGTLSTPFLSYRHDLRTGFPHLSSRFLKPDNPGKEMIWMLSGSSNIKPLQEMGVPFWNGFADETGELGPIYGYLWRHWPKTGGGGEIDQVQYVLDLLKNNPDSRRMVVSGWHPEFIPDSSRDPKENYKFGHSALTACHYAWQVTTQQLTFEERVRHFEERYLAIWPELCAKGKAGYQEVTEVMDRFDCPTRALDLQFVMRSNDFVLGNPANWGMYAHLTHMLAEVNNMVPRFLCYSGMDVHVYRNHLDGVEQQLAYADTHPEIFYNKIKLVLLNETDDLFSIKPDDFVYQGFDKSKVGPAIKFPIAI